MYVCMELPPDALISGMLILKLEEIQEESKHNIMGGINYSSPKTITAKFVS